MTILSSMQQAKEFMELGSKLKSQQNFLSTKKLFEGVPPSCSARAPSAHLVWSGRTSSNTCVFMA